MIDLKDMQCIAALARHRHFARAAEATGLSQPAFSMRIRGIEDRLGTTLVRRGNRFQGFTAEGEGVVVHARRVLDEVRAMEQDLRAARGDLSGRLTLAVVPTAAAYAAHLTARLTAKHPNINVRIESASSLVIQQGLVDGRYDAGLSYAEGVPSELLTATPLYDESYVLLAPTGLAPRDVGQVTWAELADLPLTLLAPDMQNRRILDAVFQDAGVLPRVVAETSDHATALALVAEGQVATVLPAVLVETLGPVSGTIVLHLSAPEVSREIALLSLAKSPGLPLVEALRTTAESDKQH